MKPNLSLDPTVKIGDLLTTFAVVISFIALITTVARDREDREREAAGKVRAAAAAVITKLDRWEALQASLYQELQPTFVELSESLLQDYNTISVRDQFWKKVNSERTKIAVRIIEEQLGTSYADLIAYYPSAREQFLHVHAKLAQEENLVTESFLSEGEDRILRLQNQRASYTTAVLGNALRDAAQVHAAEIKKRSEEAIAPFREHLFSVIRQSDEEIIRTSRMAANPSIERTATDKPASGAPIER